MEQEPIYVTSSTLTRVCEAVLARIYEARQVSQEEYVTARVMAYNQAAYKSNKWRKVFKCVGVKPRDYITPYGMELMLQDEVKAMPVEQQAQHPVCKIHTQYGGLEHETKDCMIQCGLNETVAVSADMARGISHLGIPLDFMAKPRFGFYPR